MDLLETTGITVRSFSKSENLPLRRWLIYRSLCNLQPTASDGYEKETPITMGVLLSSAMDPVSSEHSLEAQTFRFQLTLVFELFPCTGNGEKRMQIPDGHAGEVWTDVLGWSQGEITIGEDVSLLLSCRLDVPHR